MSSTLNVFVRSPDTRSERRLDPHTTIANLKTKFELITGIPVQNQAIALYESEEDNAALIANLDDDSRPLGFYGVRDYQMLKVSDTNPSTSFTGQLSDFSNVDKYELPDEEYAKRQDSVLAYKQLHKVGRFAEPSTSTTPQHATSVDIPLGSRCEVDSTEPDLRKRGTVRFVGETKFGKEGGVWIGIEYDEPMGKNDGSVQGERYFSCRPNYGVFVRADRVKVGDYPVEEIDLDEEM